MTTLRPALLLVLAALLASCGGNGNPGLPDGINRSVVSVELVPSPLVFKASTTAIGYLNVSYTVLIKELTGLGGEFIFVNATIYEEPTGLSVAVNNYDSKDLIVFVGSKRLEGNSQVEIKQQIDYLLVETSTGARVAVNVQFRDDRGNVLNQSILMPIVPVEAPATGL